MRVSVCVGNYAKTPYCVPGLEMNVYSMEELCHCMKENAFFLDTALMEDGLLGWIERECGLRELAKALHPLVHRQGSLSAFVLAILRYVGFYDEAVLQETESLLRQGAGLTGLEKRKSQLDYLVKKKRFRQALRGYDELLRCLEEAQGTEAGTGKASVEKGGSAKKEFLAKIWHNKGVAYAGLMLYKKAAECFRLALEWDGGEEYLLDYLAAKRMELSEEAYVAFTSEHGEWYPGTLELEKKLERVMGEWEQQPDYLRLCNRKDIKSRDRRRFYEDNRRLTQALKESYRME